MADEKELLESEVTEPVAEPATEAVTDAESEGTPAEAPGQVDETPDTDRLAAEIAELEKRREKAREEAKYWREQKLKNRADVMRDVHGSRPRHPQPEPQEQDPFAGELVPPSPDKYETYDEYVDAKIQHELKKYRMTKDRDDYLRTQQTEAQEQVRSLQERMSIGHEKYPDFDEVALDVSVPITPAMADILSESEIPADVAYYLGKNRVECLKISRMRPAAAAKAMAKIELELSSNPPKPVSPAQPSAPSTPTSKAPPPIKLLSGAGSAGVNKDPEKMTQREFAKWREAQGAKLY